ncbi:MAG: hypothetical protein H6816_07365 [Phycisphaerales bacterium]|nr:hypothetical protein [Phycisphaerales bacterium]
MRHDGWITAALALLALAACGVARADDPRAPDPDTQTLTIRGQTYMIWPFDDLRARGFDIPDVAPEDNAFWTYVEALNAFKEVPTDLSPAFDYALETAWPSAAGKALKAYLLEPDNQKALARAREAADGEEFQLYYFGDPNGSVISVLLPSLSAYRMLGKLLIVDGRRLEAEGDYGGAMENYTTAFRMAHQVGGGITLIENLVGISIWAIGDRAVDQLVLRHNLTKEQLEVIQAALEEIAPLQPTALNGVKNERVFGLTIVDEFSANPFNVLRNIQDLTGSGGDGTLARQRESGWGRLEARFGQLVLPDRAIKQHMTNFYDELAARAARPAYDAGWTEFDEGSVIDDIPQWDIMSRMLLPSLSRASILAERCRMQTLMTRVAVALRLYAVDHDGMAPARLSDLGDLVPVDDLIDPFSGGPFVYDHRDGAWRIYSYSENLTDDNGKVGDKPFDLDYVVRFPPPAVEPFESESDEAAGTVETASVQVSN